jgi:hypothetical protein
LRATAARPADWRVVRDAKLPPQAGVLAGQRIETEALVLQFVLELIDLVLLIAEFPLQKLLVQVALAARSGKAASDHQAGPAKAE